MKPLHEKWAHEAKMLKNWQTMEERRTVWKNLIDCMYSRASRFAGKRDHDRVRSEVRAIHIFTNKNISTIVYKLATMGSPSVFFENELYHWKSRTVEAQAIGQMHGYVKIPILPHPEWNGLQIDSYMRGYLLGREAAKEDIDRGTGIYEEKYESIVKDLMNQYEIKSGGDKC